MPPNRPPYVLEAPTFRFPALAALVNRGTLGGDRESALACLVGARLCAAMLPPHPLSQAMRSQRAAGARSWLTALTMSPGVRAAYGRLFDSSGGENAGAAVALAEVMDVTAPSLDAATHSELSRLLAQLRA